MFDLVGNVLEILVLALSWAVFIYNFIISVFGWVKRKEIPAEFFMVKNKFIIFIPAHNEEKVIGSIVRNLKNLNYPKAMYDIYVIADNCIDCTAEIAANNGANVLERRDDERKSKGYSLEWAFNKFFTMGKDYDAICILDADNLVSENFLLEMNKQLVRGHQVVQGYLDSKNPHDTWVSGSQSIAYWVSDRLFQLPRYYLGLSCALGGTGFVMKTEVLREIGWNATCLTEDLEFSLRLILNGKKVAWSHQAVVYDEKPLTLKQSWSQRKRWMQGHFDCAKRFFYDLLQKAIRDKDRVSLDAAIYLLQPFIIAINGIALLTGIAVFLTDIRHFLIKENLFLIGIFILVLTYYTVIFVVIEGKMSLKILKYFLIFPFFSLTWVPVIIHGFIDRNKCQWVHTEHVRDLEIKDMKQAGS